MSFLWMREGVPAARRHSGVKHRPFMPSDIALASGQKDYSANAVLSLRSQSRSREKKRSRVQRQSGVIPVWSVCFSLHLHSLSGFKVHILTSSERVCLLTLEMVRKWTEYMTDDWLAGGKNHYFLIFCFIRCFKKGVTRKTMARMTVDIECF